MSTLRQFFVQDEPKVDVPIKKLRNNGFTLIELLISLVILSIGLLGLAALEVAALRYNHQSYDMAMAAAQIQNMADRMRANPVGVSNGAYNSISGIPSNPNCSGCSPNLIAQQDAYQWNTANATSIPSGQGTVVGNGTTFTITVRWDADHSGATGTGCSGNPQVDLSCLVMSFMP